MKPLFVIISIGVSNPKFTPAKLAFAGTVFSATVAEVFTPVASGFAIAWVNDPLKSPKTGNWFSSVIGSSTRSGRGVHVSNHALSRKTYQVRLKTFFSPFLRVLIIFIWKSKIGHSPLL